MRKSSATTRTAVGTLDEGNVEIDTQQDLLAF